MNRKIVPLPVADDRIVPLTLGDAWTPPQVAPQHPSAYGRSLRDRVVEEFQPVTTTTLYVVQIEEGNEWYDTEHVFQQGIILTLASEAALNKAQALANEGQHTRVVERKVPKS